MKLLRINALVAFMALSFSQSAYAQDSNLFEVERMGSAGPVVLFLPAIDCHADVWRPVMESLAGEYRTIAVTPVGMAGVAPAGLQNSFFGEIVPELSLLLANENAQGATVVGHTLGGMTALMLAKAEPDRVAQVLVVETVPFMLAMMGPGMTAEAAKPMADMMVQQMNAMPEEMYQNARKGELRMLSKSPEFRSRLEEWMLASDRATVVNAMKESISTDLRPELAEIAQPIVVLAAWDSSVIPVPKDMIQSAYDQQYSSAPNARVVIVENSLSYVMIDQPEAFGSALNELLGR